MASKRKVEGISSTLGKVVDHLWGKQTKEFLRDASERIGSIEVDRLRVKPLVKVTGEFFAQTTEGDGNFHMFQFLEREGAEVKVETHCQLDHVSAVAIKSTHADRKWLDMTRPKPWMLHKRALAS
jgi:predicted nucleotide-binding protein (sugar kinase/HSP70/actin superfamily)